MRLHNPLPNRSNFTRADQDCQVEIEQQLTVMRYLIIITFLPPLSFFYPVIFVHSIISSLVPPLPSLTPYPCPVIASLHPTLISLSYPSPSPCPHLTSPLSPPLVPSLILCFLFFSSPQSLPPLEHARPLQGTMAAQIQVRK